MSGTRRAVVIESLRAITSLVVIMLVAVACASGPSQPNPPNKKGARTLTVSSPAFAAGRPIPAKYSCDGAGVSPPLAWRGVPAKARELALVVDDPDAPGGTYTHWIVMDIPSGRPRWRRGRCRRTRYRSPTHQGSAGMHRCARRVAPITTGSPCTRSRHPPICPTAR